MTEGVSLPDTLKITLTERRPIGLAAQLGPTVGSMAQAFDTSRATVRAAVVDHRGN